MKFLTITDIALNAWKDKIKDARLFIDDLHVSFAISDLKSIAIANLLAVTREIDIRLSEDNSFQKPEPDLQVIQGSRLETWNQLLEEMLDANAHDLNALLKIQASLHDAAANFDLRVAELYMQKAIESLPESGSKEEKEQIELRIDLDPFALS